MTNYPFLAKVIDPFNLQLKHPIQMDLGSFVIVQIIAPDLPGDNKKEENPYSLRGAPYQYVEPYKGVE